MIKIFIKHHIIDYALTYALNNAIINLMFPELKKMSAAEIRKHKLIEKWKPLVDLSSVSNDVTADYLENMMPSAMIEQLLENQILMSQIGNLNNPNKPRSSR